MIGEVLPKNLAMQHDVVATVQEPLCPQILQPLGARRIMLSNFEKQHEALLSNRRFAKRLFFYALFGVSIEAVLVILGSIGFHYFEGLGWLDAAMNTTMVITGNGPPYEPQSNAGKIFQIAFSLTGVVIFALVVSVMLAPVFHRLLHAFHDQQHSDNDN
jgi:hypothetical protein